MVGYIFRISGLIIGITSLALIFILLKYGYRRSHYIWTFFNLAVGSWGFANFFTGLVNDEASALVFWKLGIVSGIFTAIITYHVIVNLGELRRKKILLIFYLYGFIFSFLTIFNLSGLKVSYLYNSIFYATASDMRLVILSGIWATMLFYALYELFKLYNRSYGDKKLQFNYLLIGFSTGFTGATLTMLPWFGFTNLPYPAANILIWFYLVIVTYAILRHQLLGIEVIVKKTLVFAGLLASVFAMLILPTLIIQEYIFGKGGVGGRLVGLTISGLIIILTVRRIEDFLINITDKYLFQKKYNYKELLKTFTSEVLTILDLNNLVKMTVSKLSEIIKLGSCGILLLDKEKNEYKLVASQGIKEKDMKLQLDNTLTTFLSRTKTYLSVSTHEKEYKIPERIRQDMNRLHLELAIPLTTLQGEMMGILTLGKKKSDEDYTQDDMDILLPLARTLAIAISNAEMFTELGKTQAEAAQREKMAVIGTLSAGINHEICNPLGIARGQCEAFLLNMRDGLYKNKTSDELLEKAQIIMSKVIHETDRATTITKKLSSFAKPSKGIVLDDVDVKHEIGEVLGLVGYELKLDKIDIAQDIEDSLPFISADKKQLQEVFFNLIRNAAQAMDERGRIDIVAKEKNGKVRIDIQDTGHGIPENKLEQIFNPFYTTKDPGKGTGLGLFIVKQVVEKNHGKISVKSKEGEGTTFTLEFPLSVREKA